jgi:arylsulfatase A-like enzyme
MNVLLVSLDTLRADHLSCYGYPRLTSPHLDRLAGQGAVFRQCIAPHIPTHPGHTTVFTGHDVFTHQIVTHGGTVELDPGIPTLAERLKAAGYFTAAADNLGRWFRRGFDVYETYSWTPDPKGRWPKAEAVNAAADRVFARIAAEGRPFFCFLHYWDVHTPYLPPDPFWGMFYDGDPKDPRNHSLDAMWAFEPFRWYFHEWMPGVTDVEFPKAQYDAALAYMDVCLEHMLVMLHRRGLDQDTLVVFFADHGEELDEHRMWFDHHGLYETNIHVPLILWAPGRVPAGRVFDGLVSHYDIAPTVLEACGIDPSGLGLAGRSLWPILRGEASGAEGTVSALYVTECSWMRKHAWRTREWKLILALEPDFHHMPPVELYHLPSDPMEQRNLAEQRPEVVAELRQQLLAHVARREAETGRPAPITVQGITMRRIGTVRAAIPTEAPLVQAERTQAPAAAETPRGEGTAARAQAGRAAGKARKETRQPRTSS